jgi:hypothetical protein
MAAALLPALYRLLALAALAVGAALLASCGADETDGPGTTPGEPVPLPAGEWTWIELEGSICSDGSPTGIAVNPGPGPAPDLLVFLDGGGACWDAATCFGFADLPPAAKPGPFGRAEFEARRQDIPGSLLDREAPGNPYRGFTLAFVPYCTGDVHAGDASRDYAGAPRRYHHHGRRNVAAAGDYLAAHLPAPARLVVSGASAGGFGALLAHDALRPRWPAAKGYLVDDSGPPLVGNDFSPVLRAAWTVAWRLDEAVLPVCGDACARDLSLLVPALAERWPADRLALLSRMRDDVIRAFVGLGPAAFETALLRLRDERFSPLGGQAATFYVPGSGHTMLGDPARFEAGGVALPEWLRRQVEDDPAWASAGP